MAKDLKELNFGYNNDLSYDTSHRGLSPFAVIGVSMLEASKRRRHADWFYRTSQLTLAEVAQSETTRPRKSTTALRDFPKADGR